MFDDNPEPAWFCLKAQPKHEHIASAHLRQMRDVEVFSPRIRLQRSTARGLRWFEESMFPGYLFARFAFIEHHKEVRYAMGISAILNFGGRYASLEDSVIEGLRSKTDSQQIATVKAEVTEGDSVKIVEGALRGLEGVVTHMLSGKERVRVLLNFLGREIQAEVGKFGLLPPQRHPLAA